MHRHESDPRGLARREDDWMVPSIATSALRQIAETLGEIGDLPQEWIDTIANTYYLVELRRAEGQTDRGTFPAKTFSFLGLARTGSIMDRMVKFNARMAQAIAAAQSIPKFVAAYRSARAKGPEGMDLFDLLFRAVFQYNISDAEKKPAFWLRLECMLKSRSVRQVPKLYERMVLCSEKGTT